MLACRYLFAFSDELHTQAQRFFQTTVSDVCGLTRLGKFAKFKEMLLTSDEQLFGTQVAHSVAPGEQYTSIPVPRESKCS